MRMKKRIQHSCPSLRRRGLRKRAEGVLRFCLPWVCALPPWGCTTDALAPEAEGLRPQKVILEAVIAQEPATKTRAYGNRTVWETGDRIAVYSYQNRRMEYTCFTHIGEEGNVGLFEGTPPWSLQDKRLLALYPYKQKYAPYAASALHEYIPISVPREQWQFGTRNVDFVDILFAELLPRDSETRLRFRHLWSVIELRMTSQVPGVKVDSVVLCGPLDSITVDIEVLAPNVYWEKGVVDPHSSLRVQKLTLRVEDAPELDPLAYFPMQIAVSPGSNRGLRMEVYLSGSVNTMIYKEWDQVLHLYNGVKNITYLDYS